MAFWDAVRIFFRTLFDRQVAEKVREILAGKAPSAVPGEVEARPARPIAQPAPSGLKRAGKSEALILLETLQREARFIDFIKEELSAYSDAQIGAAVRDIHRDCAAVLERLFAIRPVIELPEGTEYTLEANFDSGRFRVVGHVQGHPPYRGRITHHGWEATECRIPVWTGPETAVRIIAPAEVEVGRSGTVS